MTHEEHLLNQAFQDIWDEDYKKRQEAMDALEVLFIGSCGWFWLSSREPLFRHWDRIPEPLRKKLSYLHAEDTSSLRDDYIAQLVPPKKDW